MRTVEQQIEYIQSSPKDLLNEACQFHASESLLLNLLGLDDKNTAADIGTRYRKLSKHFHPDKFNGDPLFFKAIANANGKLIAGISLAAPIHNTPPPKTTPTHNASPPHDYNTEWEKQGRELIKSGHGPLLFLKFSLLTFEDQKKLAIFLGMQQDGFMQNFIAQIIKELVRKAAAAEDRIYTIGSQYLRPEKRDSFPISLEALHYLAQKDERALVVLWGMQQENIAFDKNEMVSLIALAKERFEQHNGELGETDAAYHEKGLNSILNRTANVPIEVFESFDRLLRPQEQKELALLLGKEIAGEPFYEERKKDLVEMAVYRINLGIKGAGMQVIRQNARLHKMLQYLNAEEKNSLVILFGRQKESRPFNETLMEELLQHAEDRLNADSYNTAIQQINSGHATISLAAFTLLSEAEQKSFATLFGLQLNGSMNKKDISLMNELIQKAENQLKAQTPKPLDQTLKPISTKLDIIKINCESVISGIEALAKGNRSVHIEILEHRLEKQDTEANTVNNELLAIQAQYEQSPEYEKIVSRQKEYKDLILRLKDTLKQETIKKEEKTPVAQPINVGFFSPPPTPILAICQAPTAQAPAAQAPAAQAPVPVALQASAIFQDPMASQTSVSSVSSASSGLIHRRLGRK